MITIKLLIWRRSELLYAENHQLQQTISGNRSGTSDPAGMRGTKLAELQEVERWIKLIAEVEAKLPWRKRIFLQLRREYRYAPGQKGWTAAV